MLIINCVNMLHCVNRLSSNLVMLMFALFGDVGINLVFDKFLIFQNLCTRSSKCELAIVERGSPDPSILTPGLQVETAY